MDYYRFCSLVRPLIQELRPIPTGVKPRYAVAHPIKAVIFDVYGTLLVSASGDIGVNPAPEVAIARIDELIRRHDAGFSASELQSRMQKAIIERHRELKGRGVDFPEVNIQRIWETVLGWQDSNKLQEFALEYEMIVNPVYPMPGFKAALGQLKSMGLALGLISNAQFYTPWLLSYFMESDWREHFAPEFSLFSYETGIAKPSLALYRQAAARLKQVDIKPEDVLYVGNDMLKDILPASQIGFLTVLFAGDKRSLKKRADDPRCRNLAPDWILTNLDQIPTAIDNLI